MKKTDFETLLQRAETAYQQAKMKGDGQVIEWTEELELSIPQSRKFKRLRVLSEAFSFAEVKFAL